jgi:hypothetical protein
VLLAEDPITGATGAPVFTHTHTHTHTLSGLLWRVAGLMLAAGSGCGSVTLSLAWLSFSPPETLPYACFMSFAPGLLRQLFPHQTFASVVLTSILYVWDHPSLQCDLAMPF